MKKILFTVLMVLCVVGCSGSYYYKIDYDDLLEKLDNKESFILFFNDGSDNGILLKNKLNKILKENEISAFEINPTKISEDEENELKLSFSYEDVSIIFIKDGVNPSKLTHVTDAFITEKELTNYIKNLGFIN